MMLNDGEIKVYSDVTMPSARPWYAEYWARGAELGEQLPEAIPGYFATSEMAEAHAVRWILHNDDHDNTRKQS